MAKEWFPPVPPSKKAVFGLYVEKRMLHKPQAVRPLRRNLKVSKRRHEIYLSGTGQRSAGRAEVFVCI